MAGVKSSKKTRKKASKKVPVRKPPKTVGRKQRRFQGRFWRLLRWPARVVLGLAVFACVWVFSYRMIDPPGGFYIASEAWRLDGINREWRDLEDISPRLVRAVIAAEDARFCDHYGFDFEAIQAAIESNREGRRVRGGSTITQQVAKNVFLWHQRSWVRKGLEAGFTVLIEFLWPKRRIIEVYLNNVEFAEGVFGAEAAAQHHFGRPALAVTPTHAARLAAVLPSPKTRNAGRPTSGLKRRSRSILAGARTIQAEGRDGCVWE